MPSEINIGLLQTPTEKPHHYTYLKEFRTSQCPLFLQHKCTQHRPFTCFHWHFMNQRRRRPVRKRDGTFSYSPDHYCAKYDETTGICPDGDECPYLHRTAGDTERRYHLRYYKTGTCVHETDARGHCTKNGPHCAFAHGAHDLRPALYDIREVQTMEVSERTELTPVGTPSSLEKERILLDDPNWNDTTYVLACYKTEPCKRPPRLCRQGYACPQFHNSRDRRRSPKQYKYRSTPCPHVKHGDDWGDPGQCETGDECSYCHTRTEQQFHPEIYKSTKCNDMAQTSYCPRGPFCAFAHVDQEMSGHRDVHMGMDNSLAAFVSNVLPNLPENQQYTLHNNSDGKFNMMSSIGEYSSIAKTNRAFGQQQQSHQQQNHIGLHQRHSVSGSTPPGSMTSSVPSGSPGNPQPQPTSQQYAAMLYSQAQTNTVASSNTKTRLSSSTPATIAEVVGFGAQYQHLAPGSERVDPRRGRHHSLTMENPADATRQANTLLGLSDLGVSSSSPITNTDSGTIMSPSNIMSPNAPSFYPPGETVESVIGNALEDMSMDDFDLSSIDKELEKDDTNSMSSSYGTAGLSQSYLGATSVPVNIPANHRNNHYRGSLGSLSQSPSSPFGSSDHSQSQSQLLGSLPRQQQLQQLQQEHKQEQMLEQVMIDAAAAFNRQPNPGKYAVSAQPNALGSDVLSMATGQSPFMMGSPLTSSSLSPSLMTSSGMSPSMASEVQRLRDELATNKAKLTSWEEGISQARSACEAWRKEAEEAMRKARQCEEERNQAIKQRDEVVQQLALKTSASPTTAAPPSSTALSSGDSKSDDSCTCRFLHSVNDVESVQVLSTSHLSLVKQQIQTDVQRLEQLSSSRSSLKCLSCNDHARTLVVLPCEHFTLCDACVATRQDCPYCHGQIVSTRRETPT